MIAVIFEMWPAEGRIDEYFSLAGSLREELATIDGFISIERFESVVTQGKFVSLSFWRDEDAVRAWRNRDKHRYAQARGRDGIFRDYRLRVATVLRDYSMTERGEAPADSREAHSG
jgi:heme-degrading monooxygenase HmoA